MIPFYTGSGSKPYRTGTVIIYDSGSGSVEVCNWITGAGPVMVLQGQKVMVPTSVPDPKLIILDPDPQNENQEFRIRILLLLEMVKIKFSILFIMKPQMG